MQKIQKMLFEERICYLEKVNNLILIKTHSE